MRRRGRVRVDGRRDVGLSVQERADSCARELEEPAAECDLSPKPQTVDRRGRVAANDSRGDERSLQILRRETPARTGESAQNRDLDGSAPAQTSLASGVASAATRRRRARSMRKPAPN
jgi:hypothetical protein